MTTSSFCYLGRLAVGVVVAGLISVCMAIAQTSPNSLEQFSANPSQVLAQNSNGAARLTSLICDVTTSRPDALQTPVNALTGASTNQQSAIAGSSSADAKTAYATVVGDTLIGAVGGTGVGGGGAIGAGVFGTGMNAFAGQGSPTNFQTSTQIFTGVAAVLAEHPQLPA